MLPMLAMLVAGYMADFLYKNTSTPQSHLLDHRHPEDAAQAGSIDITATLLAHRCARSPGRQA
jgi:hypothetical protein